MSKKSVMPSLTESNLVSFNKADSICRFCYEDTKVPAWDKRIIHHLVITMDDTGHCHVHGPLTDKIAMQRMLDLAKKEMETN